MVTLEQNTHRCANSFAWGLSALTLLLSLLFASTQAQAVTETWCFNGATSTADLC